ncbi:MAG: hypothetical protein HOO01_04380 [Cellvibrionales bacterium]|nr:hypothetical protein [Cellvibrionales bacterium]
MRIYRELMFEEADASVKKYGVRGTRDLLTDLQSTAKRSRRAAGGMHA